MKKKKALIVRLSSLGDVIFNLPLAATLKDNGYEVTWITSEKGYGVIKNNPLVDEAILAPLKKWKNQKFGDNFKEYLTLVKHIRSKHFDVAIDNQLLIKSFIWMIFSGAKKRLVSNMAREFSFLGGNIIIDSKSNWQKEHITQTYLNFVRHLGLNTGSVKAALPPSSKETITKVDTLLSNIDKSKPLVSIAPATTWTPKHWNKDNWKLLVSKLETDYTLVFTGMDSDSELINYISEGKHLSVAGKTNLPELIEIFNRSQLLISLDSGSTHLAWASGLPKIVSIFCCTPTIKYAPIGPSDKYIALTGHIDCQPCHKRICPLRTNDCTLNPSVEEVLEAVHKLIPIK